LKDGHWTNPVGKFKEGEDEYRCAKRELEEKTGFVVGMKDLTSPRVGGFSKPAIRMFNDDDGVTYRTHVLLTSVENATSAEGFSPGMEVGDHHTNVAFFQIEDALTLTPARACLKYVEICLPEEGDRGKASSSGTPLTMNWADSVPDSESNSSGPSLRSGGRKRSRRR